MTNIKTIVENDLCIGCGACLYACKQGNLQMNFNDRKGMFEPKILDEHKCEECTCIGVCPSYLMNYDELSQYRFGKPSDSDIGHSVGIYLAQNVDKNVNLAASSGGVIKATLQYYMNNKRVDSIIALKRSEGIAYKPALIDDVEEINNLPGSIYHNVDFSDAIGLIQKARGKVALVAIPCQLEGIYSYLKKYSPELFQKIEITIGLLCGWTYSHHSIKALCTYEGIPNEKVVDISYRGDGPVGKLKFEIENGQVIKVNRRINLKYQAAFDRSYNLPRCHYCVNHGNFLADLVVGDAWLPSTVGTKTGISLVIARTADADASMQGMKAEGLLKLLPARREDVVESQSRRVIFGDFSYAYAEFVKNQGMFSPTLSGPNKAQAKFVSEEKLRKFHDALLIKRKLQCEGKYWKLFFRKYTRELKDFILKYVTWFFVRIVKIKSIFGKRKEISSDLMKNFS